MNLIKTINRKKRTLLFMKRVCARLEGDINCLKEALNEQEDIPFCEDLLEETEIVC